MITTIGSKIEIRGRMPFLDGDVEMIITPSNFGSGFTFVVDSEGIPVSHEYLVQMPEGYNTTVLEKNGKRVMFTEHLLSALVGCGIDSATIELIGGNQPPFLDPSAKTFCNLIRSSGCVSRNGAKKVLEVKKDIIFGDNGSYAVIRSGLTNKISIICDYPIPIGVQYFSIENMNPEVYLYEIGWARTFIRVQMGKKEWDGRRVYVKFLPKKIGDSPIPVADKHGNWIVVPYSSDEPARHKVLDLIGDLATLGTKIVGEIFVVRPGHDFNRKLVQYLGKLV